VIVQKRSTIKQTAAPKWIEKQKCIQKQEIKILQNQNLTEITHLKWKEDKTTELFLQ